MSPSSSYSTRWFALMVSRYAVFFLFGTLILCRATSAADAMQIHAAIEKGASSLQRQYAAAGENHRPLMALAMFKAGIPAESPEIQQTLKAILARCPDAAYIPATDQVYEAGIDATLLADLDAKLYKPHLALIADYIRSTQLPSGGWDYPPPRSRGNQGDTSVTQYACLGLWAAQRSGVEIDPEVWLNVLNWHVRFQNRDGGFSYCPTSAENQSESSTLNMSVNALGSIHIAMLQLEPAFLPLTSADRRPAQIAPTPKKKFGVLEELAITPPVPKVSRKIPGEAVETAKKTYSFLGHRFAVENNESSFKTYYYYSLERMGALANVKKVGEHEWYQECADFVLSKQSSDGSWTFASGPQLDTAFCVLFLSQSTAKILKRSHEPEYGQGTMAGGRGLPDDLTASRFDGRTVRGKNDPQQPLDELFSALRNTGDIPLEKMQDQIVAQVQSGDREQLIGQIDQIKQLARSPQPEVRRTALWALGRSDRIELATILINGLNDPDLRVIIEARNALCWLSRKPTGFGEAEDPLKSLAEDASDQQRKDAIAAWHRQLVINWGKWYLEQRPYDDRGDRFESDLRAQIRRLQGLDDRRK